MSIEKNIQTVKDFFAAIGRGDKEGLLALELSSSFGQTFAQFGTPNENLGETGGTSTNL